MPVHIERRQVFPLLLNCGERSLLRQLATERKQSQCETLRELLFREFSTRQRSRLRHSEEAVARK